MNGYQRFRDQFAQAMDGRLFTIEYLDALIISGKARCWATQTAAIVAEIKAYPTGAKVVSGLIAAGELAGVVALIPHAEQWGREQGCIFGMIESREGWAREMKPHGYEPFQVSLIMEL
jgi:hypothetical protein